MFDFHWNALNLKRLDTLREKTERFACQNFLFFLKINYILNLDDRQRGDNFWQLSNIIFKEMGNNISDSLHISVISRSLILPFIPPRTDSFSKAALVTSIACIVLAPVSLLMQLAPQIRQFLHFTQEKFHLYNKGVSITLIPLHLLCLFLSLWSCQSKIWQECNY